MRSRFLAQSAPRALAVRLGLLPAVLVTLAHATGAATESGAALAIRTIVDDARHADLRWSDFPYYQDEMRGLYAPVGYAPFWLVDGAPRPQVRDVLAVLGDAPSRGLDPGDYDLPYLQAGFARLGAENAPEPAALGRLDAATSLALFRYISDLHIGRLTPRKVAVGIDVDAKKYDLPAVVRRAVEEDRIRQTVAEAEPQLAIYERMKDALQRYQRLAGDPAVPPLRFPATLRSGDTCAALAALAARLVAVGDLDSAAAPSEAGTYGGAVEAAVKRFQARHGLAADGIVGPGTLGALNVPPQARVRQLELGLERLRWLPDLRGRKLLVVNIPAFQVWGFDSLAATHHPALHMRVVVGKALNTRTPVFQEDMQYVVFRPYWNVPRSIVRGELLPALQRDSQALGKRDMELVRGFDDAAGLPVTPENIDKLAAGQINVRQRPGPRNALGLAKFIFPNSDDIYMHGTPSQALFERSRRDFSHGCIRLEDPAAMAAFVLADQPEWTRERILAAMNGSTPQRVNLQRRIPVFVFYTTAIVDLEGAVHFYDDIYGHDARLEKELATRYSQQP